MSYDDELAELARLLRLGAEAARNIASIRKINEAEIFALADQADAIADGMIALAQPQRQLPPSSVH